MNRRSFNQLIVATGLASLLGSDIPLSGAQHLSEAAPKFSVMLWTLSQKLSFEEKMQVAADAGYGSVEVGNEYLNWTPLEWKRNLARKHSLGMTIDSAVPGRNALADRSRRTALRDDLLRAIPGAKDLGCSQFIYTAYTRVPGQSLFQQRAAIVDTLKYAADLLEKDQIEIVLEPIDLLEYEQEAVPSVSEAFEIVRVVNSPRVKVLYDFYHEQRQSGNLIEKLADNIDLVGLVHVADVPGRHRPGTGEINYQNLYRALAKLKYQRYICMEFLPAGDPVAELKAARLEAVAAMIGQPSVTK